MPWTGPHPQPDCPYCSDDFIGLVGTHCTNCRMEGSRVAEEDDEDDLTSCDWCGDSVLSEDLVRRGDAEVCEDCGSSADYDDQVRGDYRSMVL